MIDDHTLFRSGLKALLQRQSDFAVVGEAADGLEGVKLIELVAPDVVLLDLDMPHMNGREALAQIGAASATRFDPSVVLACIGAADSFAAIAGEYADDAASIHCELQRLEASLGESIELTLPR